MRAWGLLLLLSCACTSQLSVGAAVRGVSGVGAALGVVKPAKVSVRLDAWNRLANATGGVTFAVAGASGIAAVILGVFDQGLHSGDPVDVVFVVDTTGSMRDDIDAMIQEMQRILGRLHAHNPDYQVGFVAYRDRGDAYISRTELVLTHDDAAVQRTIANIVVDGGGDDPEHVYAGLYTALTEQPWRPGVMHHIILMGDAPPHEDYTDDPRNFQSVTELARERAVEIHGIGIKCDRCD